MNSLTGFEKGTQIKGDCVVRQPGPGPSETEKEAFLQSLVAACLKTSMLKEWPKFVQPESDQLLLLVMDMTTLYERALDGLATSTLEEKVSELIGSGFVQVM